MENVNNHLSRKRFIGWGVGLGSLLALPAFLRFPKKKKQTQTVKMLTQEGKLVEIEVANIPDKKKKVSNADIHTWIHKKSTSL